MKFHSFSTFFLVAISHCYSDFGNTVEANRNLRGSTQEGVRSLFESRTGMICKEKFLKENQILYRGEAICKLIYDAFGLDNDGNLVWIHADEDGTLHELWHPNHDPADFLKMQEDGNLVARRTDGTPVWRSRTQGKPHSVLATQCSWPSNKCRVFITGDDLSWEIFGPSDFICRGDTLDTDEYLSNGEYLCAGEYRFGIDGVGKLRLEQISRKSDGIDVENQEWETLFQANQEGQLGHKISMHSDGNLCVKDESGISLWCTSTAGNPDAKAILFNSGRVIITTSLNAPNPIWEGDYKPDWSCVRHSLGPNEVLMNGEYICKGDHSLGLVDGRLLAETYNGVSWKTDFESTLFTGGVGNQLVMQGDGNLVIYSDIGEPLWSSRTNGQANLVLGFDRVNYSHYFPRWTSAKFQSMDGVTTTYLKNEEQKCIGEELNININGGRMDSGEVLCNNHHYFGMDGTGDLALWNRLVRYEKMWSANTGGSYGNYMKVQDDGNLVVYKFDGSPLWSSGTGGSGAVKLQIDSNGNVALVTEENEEIIWSMEGYSVLPGASCVSRPVLPGQRLEKNQEICDGLGSFGLDRDGRLTSTSNLYYVFPYAWYGGQIDMGGRSGHHAYFQDDGNFVVYSEDNEALWSTRTNVGYPKEKVEYNCYSRALCSLEFVDGGESKEWNPKAFYCRDRIIPTGGRLDPNEYICSENNGHRFGPDSMGDVSLWLRGRKIVSTGTSGSYGNHLVMQGDGNLVVYDYKMNPLWSSGTDNNPGAYASIDDAGVVSVITSEGTTIWSMS